MTNETEYYALYNSRNGQLVGTLKGKLVVDTVLDDLKESGYVNIAPEKIPEAKYHLLRKQISDRIVCSEGVEAILNKDN